MTLLGKPNWVHLILVSFLIQLFTNNDSAAQKTQVDSLTTIYETTNVDSVRFDAGISILRYYSARNPAKLESLADTLLSEAKLKLYPVRYATVTAAKIIALNRTSRYKESIQLTKALESHAIKNDLKQYQAIAYNGRGNAYYFIGEYEKSADVLYVAFEIAQELQNVTLQINALNNLANTYMITEEYEKVYSIYRQALEIATDNNRVRDRGMILTSLGNLENKRQNLTIARDNFEEALHIFEEIENKYGIGLALANLGHVEYQARNYNKALDYNEKSRLVREDLKDRIGLLRLYINNANIYKEKASWDKALDQAYQALALLEEVSRPDDMKMVLETMTEVYERSGVYDSALFTLRKLSLLKDSLFNVDLNNSLVARKGAIDTTRYQQRIVELENSEVSLKQRNTWILIISIASVMVLLFLLWREKSRIDKIREENKLIKGKRKKSDESSKVEGLMTRLKEGGLDGAFWIEFGLKFDEIHPGFSHNLTNKHPEITKNELRVCCLIRLGLNIYDLAECLMITTNSVRKSRYRIYKKMGLESDKHLFNYLFSL